MRRYLRWFLTLDRQPVANFPLPDDSDEEWHGITSISREASDREYENEEVLATVTVVEDFDPDIMIHGPSHPIPRYELEPEPEPSSAKFSRSKPKTKTTKIYYENKHSRRKERMKQQARKSKKAEREQKASELRKRNRPR